MRHSARWALAALSVVVVNAAQAHDTWLLAAVGDTPTAFAFELTSGMDFPNADYAIEPSRILKSGCRVDGGECTLQVGERGAKALALSAELPADAPALAWIELAAKTLSLDDAHVEEYLAEIDAEPSVRAAWMAQTPPRHWRERYTKHAKSLLGSRSGKVWSTPVGSALELVPAAASMLPRDSDASFQLLSGGKPLANFPVGIVGGSAAKPHVVRSDADGKLRVRIDRSGHWLLRATRITPANEADLDWTSQFATLTFQVR